MTANGLDTRVAVVHWCFLERGDSILSVISWESLRQTHMISHAGCARAPKCTELRMRAYRCTSDRADRDATWPIFNIIKISR